MRTRWMGMALALLGLAACGDEDDPMVMPASGTWTYVDEGLGENTCGNESLLYRDPTTSFRLDNPGDGTITVYQGAQAAPFSCTLDGVDLSCPSRLASETPVMNTDAVVHFNMRVDAEFSSDTAMSGTQRVDVTCEGSSCMFAPAVLGVTLPCYYTINFSATDPGPG